MNPQVELMITLLAKAKTYNAEEVPVPDSKLVADWIDVLKLWQFPPELWINAVKMWGSDPDKKRLDPGGLKRYADRVKDLWEADPRKREILQQRRQAYLNARIARGELPAGVTPIVDERALQAGKTGGSRQSRQQLRQILAKMREKRLQNATDLQRAQARAKQEKQQARFDEEARKRELAQQLTNDKKNL